MSKPQGTLGSLGLALILALGFGAVFGLAAGWGIAVWDGLHPVPVEHRELTASADGTPLIISTTSGVESSGPRYYSLDDREMPGPLEITGRRWLAGASLPVPRHRSLTSLAFENFRVVNRWSESDNNWFFLHDGARDGHGYFVGYSSHTKLCTGYIGRNGLRPDLPPIEDQFPVDTTKLASDTAFARPAGNGSWFESSFVSEFSREGYRDNRRYVQEFPLWKVEMISGDQFLEIDLRSGAVTTLLEGPGLLALGKLHSSSMSKEGGDRTLQLHRHERLAVRTADRVVIFDVTGKQRSAYLLPAEVGDRDIAFYELGTQRALVTASRKVLDGTRYEELFWIDASGKVSRQTEVSLGGGTSLRTARLDAGKFALAIPAPAVFAFLTTVSGLWISYDRGVEVDYSTVLARSLAEGWPALLAISLLSAVLACYCWRRHRRYHQPGGGVWFVFVLLLGLPGLVAYRFHRRWPVLEKCPACGRDVPRDREACAACGTPFPAPQPNGCEVFA